MKLKAEILISTNDGLKSEKEHLISELKETKELQKTYEDKCDSLNKELEKVTSEF